MDWENLEASLKKDVRMLILCNSHNPVGPGVDTGRAETGGGIVLPA